MGTGVYKNMMCRQFYRLISMFAGKNAILGWAFPKIRHAPILELVKVLTEGRMLNPSCGHKDHFTSGPA